MSFNKDGYVLLKNTLSKESIEDLKNQLAQYPKTHAGIRNAEKKLPAISTLADSKHLQSLVTDFLGDGATLVRAIIFIKNAEKNWLVPWHQDKTVCVSESFTLPGWGPWTLKDGCHHVQAPQSVLEKMLTLRIHLDPSDAQNGCLKVIPGSHALGVLDEKNLAEVVAAKTASYCPAEEGTTMIMKPLLIHASSKSTNNNPRRVLHLEYSNYSLPKGISWTH